MANAVALVVFVTGLGPSSLESLDAALEHALGSKDAVRVQAVEQLPRDVDALEAAQRDGITALVEIETETELGHVDLRVCSVDRMAECQLRSIAFAAEDARADRERAVAIVTVAMLPEATRKAATTPPAPTPAPTPQRVTPPAPPVRPRPRPPAPRFEAELAFSMALGRPTAAGAMAGVRLRVLDRIWLRAAAGARAGALAGLDATTLEIPLGLGVDARWPLGEHFALGARLDAKVQSRSVRVAGATPDREQRWLAAVSVGPELHLQLTRTMGLLLFGGLELNAGSTTIEMQSGSTSKLDVLRGYVEVGPYLTF